MRGGLIGLLWLIAASAQAQAHVERWFSLTPANPAVLPSVPTMPSAANATPPALDTNDSANGNVNDNVYTAEAVSATIYSKNLIYTTPLPIPSALTGRVTISSVTWRYSTVTRPPGFQAVLCWKDAKHCQNVSSLGQGHSDAFNGNDAAQAFQLRYQVLGSGALAPPVYGAMAQVVVSYRLWR